MGIYRCKLLYALTLGTVFAGFASASPLNSKLLPLVPPGAEIVAGFENHHEDHRHGQLVLSTHSDRLDLDDWEALSGVDGNRIFEEVIEVATSTPGRRMLTEHLVMVAGRFNKEIIFRSAELNGSQRAVCDGQTIMLVKPFAREKDEMLSERWLAIIENRIALLGTPFLVQTALRRYQTHADIDMPLMERLSQLRRDDTSWNVLLWSPRVLSNYTVAQSASAWGRLLEGAEVLMVGVRFGSRVRVEFSLHADTERGGEFFRQKAALFAEVFGDEGGAPRPRRVSDVSFEPNHVRGFVELSSQEYEEWGRQARNPHVKLVPRSTSHGE